VIGSISSIRPATVPNIAFLKRGTGKIAVPIKPSRSISARFKHITAIPARMDNEGISVYKLQILDNLIERLVGQSNRAEEYVKISSENIDTLISHFKQELSFRESSPNALYNSIKPQIGIILNVYA
jgi:hypothetical protein